MPLSPEDILVRLRDCFCEQLALSPGGAPAECCIVATSPVIAQCCAGFAWVRILTAYPSHPFPALTQAAERCLPPVWAMQVELGVSRCAPAPCGPLSNPCCDEELDATLILLGDFTAMVSTLGCCLTPTNGGLGKDEVVMGPWIVSEPDGGCVESKMTATIRFVNGCSC